MIGAVFMTSESAALASVATATHMMADAMPLSGASVTIPHKQKILRYLDIVDPLARRIGAVNTVFRKNGKWRGLNTDVQGIIGPLSKKIRLGKSSVLVVGNGGAARGAAFALADSGAKVAIVGRNADRVRALAKACNAEAKTKSLAGDERKTFMKGCLSAKAGAAESDGKALSPQQQKMKDCNAQAKTKSLAGAERKKFMSGCLKG